MVVSLLPSEIARLVLRMLTKKNDFYTLRQIQVNSYSKTNRLSRGWATFQDQGGFPKWVQLFARVQDL